MVDVPTARDPVSKTTSRSATLSGIARNCCGGRLSSTTIRRRWVTVSAAHGPAERKVLADGGIEHAELIDVDVRHLLSCCREALEQTPKSPGTCPPQRRHRSTSHEVAERSLAGP